jgi:hypothetical protein
MRGFKTHTEEKRNACGVLVRKPEGLRPIRPTQRLDNTQMHLKKQDRIAGSGQELEVLWTRLRTFGFHKILGTSSLGQYLLVSQRILCFMERMSSSPNNAL